MEDSQLVSLKDRAYSLLGFTERLKPWQEFLPYTLLLSVTFAVYGETLYFNFEWDDHLYIERNLWIRQLSLLHLQAIWTGTFLGHYAPVNLSFLAVLYHFFGMAPFGYHLAQFLLHAVCVCLLYLTLKELEAPRIALVASLLFAVHPANIETVAWIAEVKSTLAFLFFLLSFLAFIRFRATERGGYAVVCTLFLILSLLAKINTVVAPAVFLLYDYRQGILFERKKIVSLIGFFLIGVAFVVIHMSSFFWSEHALAKEALGGAYYGSLWVHLQNIPFFLWFYVRMTFFPYPLTAWHMFPVHAQFGWMVAGAWIVLLGACGLLLRRDRNTQFWTLWFVVFLAPVLQIVPNLTWVAERYLYIPAIGAFVLVGSLFFYVWDRLPRPWLRWSWEGAMIAALLLLVWRTETYLPAFQNNLTLWEATAKTCPTSAICHAGLGTALLEENQIERGMNELIRAVEIRPTPENLGRLGDAYTLNARDYRQAIIAYNMALEGGGASSATYSDVELYAKLARAHLMAGNLEEAGKAVQAGRAINANDPYLLIVSSFYESSRGNREAAIEALRGALSATGLTSGIPAFIHTYWGNAADVGRLIAYLNARPTESAAH
jgi:hypothetical protein